MKMPRTSTNFSKSQKQQLKIKVSTDTWEKQTHFWAKGKGQEDHKRAGQD